MADLLNPNSTEARLAAFLRETAAKSLVWGQHDCGLWLADWIAYWLGVDDPASDLRGRYHDAESCQRAIGSVAYPTLVGRLARRAGLRMTRTPEIGSVGVVSGPSGIVGAIRTERGWAVLGRTGFVRLPADIRVLGAWEPHHG